MAIESDEIVTPECSGKASPASYAVPPEEFTIKPIPLTPGLREVLKSADISQHGSTIIRELLVALSGILDNKIQTSENFIDSRNYTLKAAAVEYAEIILKRHRKFY